MSVFQSDPGFILLSSGASLCTFLRCCIVTLLYDVVAVFSGAGKLFGNKEMRLLMLGLDAAGKTSE